MGQKEDLQKQAKGLGIEFTDDDTIAALKEKIAAYEGSPLAQSLEDATEDLDQRSFTMAEVESNSDVLFGVPRSVIVGAKSAGFIKGDRLTKKRVTDGIQKFLNYRGSE